MDPFLVLLHSVSAGLANSELAELKFLCRGHLSKKKLERVQSGVDLFSMLLEQNELDSENTRLLRELLTSLRRQDLLRRLDDFEAGAAAQAAPQEEDLHAAFDIICDNVGKDWRRLARHLKVSDHKIEELPSRHRTGSLRLPRARTDTQLPACPCCVLRLFVTSPATDRWGQQRWPVTQALPSSPHLSDELLWFLDKDSS
ncbi:FAS-associated death domain protein isoform X2 [Choloepus didactylus]|uniref:FAS-associated death domain protein isoform X2 n=1 Tax=Choloepus didactylus TaxID=27675 RepID=UPI00189F9F73|nr:FAS-associated death domain protein isoform X2 [Choloepus didactylus]